MCNVLHSIHSRSYITVVIWNAFLYIHYIPYLTPQLLSYLHITIARRNIFWDAQVTYFKTYFPNSCFRLPKNWKCHRRICIVMCGRTCCTLPPDVIPQACTVVTGSTMPIWRDPPCGGTYEPSTNVPPTAYTPILFKDDSARKGKVLT